VRDRAPAGAGDGLAHSETAPAPDLRKTSSEVLAVNIAALRQRPGMPKTQADIAIATNGAMDQSTVGRTLRAKNAISIDKLDGLAPAFGVLPWQLLVPGLRTGAEGLSAKALEVAVLFDLLSVPKQQLLHATATVLHNTDALDDADSQDGRRA
jgi:transcriptional regulator with XRE-family HTH domain